MNETAKIGNATRFWGNENVSVRSKLPVRQGSSWGGEGNWDILGGGRIVWQVIRKDLKPKRGRGKFNSKHKGKKKTKNWFRPNF